MLPEPTARLRFRPMARSDLDELAALLGDPLVMAHYPAPKTRDEAADWIEWNRRNYRDLGYGLWIIETHDGGFVGDCGLTQQVVDGVCRLEIGYHVRAEQQGHGYATEAASACRDLARDDLGAPELIAIIKPDNVASRRVAEKLGLTSESETEKSGTRVVVHSIRFTAGG